MQPIECDFIYFESIKATVITKPWYARYAKLYADKHTKKWEKVMLIAGSDLKELGVNIEEEHIDCFFNAAEVHNSISSTEAFKQLIFEAHIGKREV